MFKQNQYTQMSLLSIHIQ